MKNVVQLLLCMVLFNSMDMNAQNISTKKIKANDHEFTYLDIGTGPMIIFLHGFPDNPWSFKEQMKALSHAGYHCVAPYKRGFAPGDTAVHPIHHGALYTQDVLAMIDAFKEQQVILVGHDWGAGAAYGIAKYAPGKLKAIITMAIPLSPAFFNAFTDNPEQMKRSWYLFYFQSPYAVDAFKKNDLAMLEMLWQDWSPGWNFSKEIETVKETYRKPGSVESAVNYYRHNFGNYTLIDPALVKITSAFNDGKPFIVPTLYLHGEFDGCIGVENAEGMEYLFSNKFEKHIVPGAGHFMQMEKPETVSKCIISFLKNLE